ncbi:probable serine/threonine-protein kinase roco4 [Ptychodera flava]|uniref:probable serine/threonine-protein kinase roco4 n=1 Tax=Ptychodera flava TaxID=63121 RepID=UPI00396A0415
MRSQESDVYFSLWDFAGQTIYYITHQVFLASQVIYVLVTDLTKSLDDIVHVDDSGDEWTVKRFLTFWMNSIHTYASKGSNVNLKQRDGSDKTAVAPPVIILGTKKDLLRQLQTDDGAAIDVNEEANKRLREITEYLTKHATRSVNAHFVERIAIDNLSRNKDGTTADPSVEDLRTTLQNLAAEIFFHGEVPAKWIHLEVLMRETQKEKISLDEVKEMGKVISMEEAEVMEAVAFYRGIGEIIHFQSIPEMQNTIILNAVWLVNLFKILITQSLKFKKEPTIRTRVTGLIDKLHQEGILHEDLLDYLLKGDKPLEDKTILLKIMEMYDIICEKPVKSEERRMYYLPSLIRHDAEGEKSCILPASSSVWCQLYFHFIGNFLPEGLFYRLLIRCIRRWPNCVEVIRKHMARLYFKHNDFHLTMCIEGADIQLKILVFPVDGQHSSPPRAEDVTILRQEIEEELHVVIGVYAPALEYKACVKCEGPNHEEGELLPCCEDTDDRCVPVTEGEAVVVCSICAMPLKDQKLSMWYWPEGQHKMKRHERAADQAFEGVDQLNELFCTLDEKLTQSDKRHMVNLLLHKQINQRDAENLKTPYDVFNHLRKHGHISENNLELLENVFRRMKRLPLLKYIDEYLNKYKTF